MVPQWNLGGAYAAASLLGAFLPHVADASLLGVRDTVQRIEKRHVTILNQLQRREERCATGNYMCAASLGGSCCPDNYACATDHCFATTAGGGRTCNGKKGFYPCGLEAGAGGCCPEGYICQPNGGCIPPAVGSLANLPCPANWNQCPKELGGGCCTNAPGIGCGMNQCIITTPQAFVLTKTWTTTENSKPTTATSTITTTFINSLPTGQPTGGADGFPKLFVTQLEKTQPTTVPSEGGGGGGLTTAQIGGIAGGVGALLVVVVVATFFILRRLKATQKAVDESRHGSSSATRTNRSHKHMTQSSFGGVVGFPKPTPSQVDAMEYDDLLQTNPSAVPTPMPTGGAASTIGGRVSSEMAPSSRPTPNPDGTSVRHDSVDYFDLPPRSATAGRSSAQMSVGVRSSMDSQATSAAGTQVAAAEMMGSPAPLTAAALMSQQDKKRQRHHSSSNVSVTSWGSHELAGDSALGSPGLPAELGGAAQVSELPGEEGSSSEAGASSNGNQARRRSGGGAVSGSVTRPPAAYQRATGVSQAHAPNLDVVNESVAEIHGYYGPPDAMAGQTDAGLGNVGHDISSPMAMHFQGGGLPPAGGSGNGGSDTRQS